MLYVVQLKRLVGPLSLLAVEPGVFSIDFRGAFVFAGVNGSSESLVSGNAASFACLTACFLGGVLALRLKDVVCAGRSGEGEAMDGFTGLCRLVGDAMLLVGEFTPTLRGTMGLMGSSCVSNAAGSSATGTVSADAGTCRTGEGTGLDTLLADAFAALGSGFR